MVEVIAPLRRAIGFDKRKTAPKPTKIIIARTIDQFLAGCTCDVDGHKIKIRENGYVYTIQRDVDESKRR